MTTLNVETWNSVYSEGRSLLYHPDETIVSFLSRNKGKYKKGIDIACGAGRHTLLMAEMGIEAYGIDSSEASIKYAKEQAKLRNLNAHFEHCLAQDMHFENESFDIAIMWGLLHYLSIDDQKTVVDTAHKILKKEGTLLLTLRSIEDSRAKDGKEVEPNRYLVDYFDKDTKSPKQTLMYFWDETGVRKLLSNFRQVSLGHRVIEPIGMLGVKTAHWLICVTK